jgi:hypothetical protein
MMHLPTANYSDTQRFNDTSRAAAVSLWPGAGMTEHLLRAGERRYAR